MESAAEVVLEESKSSISKKCVQEVSSTSFQQLSSSISEKNITLTMLDSDQIGNNSVAGGGNTDIVVYPAEESKLQSPIIKRPILDGNSDTSSLQSEFLAIKLTDEHGKDIGELVREKQQQKSYKSSSFVTTGGNSKDTSVSSSVLQKSDTLAAASQETSSMSYSSYVSTKKQKTVSSSTQSTSSSSSIQSSNLIERAMKSSTAVIEDNDF